MGRNRYADLLRVVSIGSVVYGHWLLISVIYQGGQLSGLDAVNYIRWGRWVTWLFQVMPVFFLVGGYVNAQSWIARRERGERWTWWMRERAVRLLWPTAVYVVVGVAVATIAHQSGVPDAELAEAAWLAALHLWFLPVYMLLAALTPLMLAAHRRWGLAVPAIMAVAAAVVDIGVHGLDIHLAGYANYLLVWGAIHQWGFAWQDRTLTEPRRHLYVMIALGASALAGLLASRVFNVDMVGSGNTNPPSIALLAFAAAQTGLVLIAEPWVSRLLARPRVWRRVRKLNGAVMFVYLWHFVPVLIVAVAFYTTGVFPQPAIGTTEWWQMRLVWFVLLTALLIPLVALVMWASRPMLRIPAGVGRAGPWSPALLAIGLVAAGFGLARLAIAGFAPGGGTPTLALVAFALGLAAIVFTGRTPSDGYEVSAAASPGDAQSATPPDAVAVSE